MRDKEYEVGVDSLGLRDKIVVCLVVINFFIL